MNTYFNEITSKPINTVDGKVVYKIPAGAMCGNGDLGVVFDNDEKDLVIHISKCDFWKFVNGVHGDGGIKTVGDLRIDNINLEEYNIKQYFDKGLLNCKFGNTEIELFVAPENLICFEIKAPETDNFSTVNINLPDTCGSVNSQSEENGVKCHSRKFCGEEVDRESAVVVCLREIDRSIADGIKTTRYCISVVTNFNAKDYINKAIEMAFGCDYDAEKAKTEEKWTNFFSASKVTLKDKEIEKFYNSSLYHLAGCMGNKEFPPGLFGNFITDDFFPWAGDYHMNYNYEAPYYCIFLTATHADVIKSPQMLYFKGFLSPKAAIYLFIILERLPAKCWKP